MTTTATPSYAGPAGGAAGGGRARSPQARAASAQQTGGERSRSGPKASEARPACCALSNQPERTPRRNPGFTLIEIMAVVLIIGLLTAIVGTAIFGQIDRARVTTAKTQIKQIEAALDFYRMDNGRYPTTDQGLEALVQQPTIEPIPRAYRPEGYLQGGRVPVDPWGVPYEYESPGVKNTYGFDLWSLGADGAPGGTGVDADLGNWAADESS